MTVFSWLLIGHLVGDWALQNDWMANGKRKAFFTIAGLTHFTIYTITIIGAVLFSGIRGKDPVFMLGVTISIFVSHWIVDATNVVDRWMRFYKQSNVPLVRVMVDQTCHMLILAGVALIWR